MPTHHLEKLLVFRPSLPGYVLSLHILNIAIATHTIGKLKYNMNTDTLHHTVNNMTLNT